jgi:hypothetical protein
MHPEPGRLSDLLAQEKQVRVSNARLPNQITMRRLQPFLEPWF